MISHNSPKHFGNSSMLRNKRELARCDLNRSYFNTSKCTTLIMSKSFSGYPLSILNYSYHLDLVHYQPLLIMLPYIKYPSAFDVYYGR